MKKLRNRLYVALLPLQLLLVGLALWTFFLLANLGALVTDAKATHEEFAAQLDNALFRLRELQVLVEMTNEVDGDRLRNDIREAREAYMESVAIVKQNPEARDASPLPALMTLNEQLKPRLDLLLQDRNDPLIAVRRAEVSQLISRAQSMLVSLSDAAIDDLLSLQDAFRERIRLSFAVLGGGILMGAFGTLMISRQIGHMILNPLEELESKLEQISQGNLEVEARLRRQDEIGKLARVFNQMVGRLREYRNLTDQKLLATTRTFRSVLQRTPHPILFLTSDFKIFFANPPAGSLLEAPEFQNGLPKELCDFAKGVLERGDIVVQERLQDSVRINVARQPKYFLITAFPVDLIDTDDTESIGLSSEGLALLLQDVTRMKLADNLKGNVVATVSHELKTPLTSARMSLYLLSEESIGALNSEQRELVDTAKEDLERQLATIQNLLDLSRFDQSDKNLHRLPCAANDIIFASIQAHQDLAESCSVELIADPAESNPIILADQKRVEIVLNNFLSNALRHAPRGSQIVLQVLHRGNKVRFNVCDQGPGVPDEYREIIFDRFTQGEDASRHGSAGLGLHIAKEIIDSHDGEIGCDSVLGEGSTFYFVLQSFSESTHEPTNNTDHANQEINS